MGVGEAGWWGRGDRSHQHGEELCVSCFKEKKVWERREERIKNACVRCIGSPPRSETRQHTKKDLCERGSCRVDAWLCGRCAFQKMELQGMRVERLWITVTCFKTEW